MHKMRLLVAAVFAAVTVVTGTVPALAWDCAKSTPVETGRAAPRPEQWWMKVAVDTNVAAKWQHPKVVFLGDSLTRRWPDNLWNMEFAPRRAANFGLDGDRIANIIWRFDNGDQEVKAAPAFVILAGTNDLGNNASASDTADGVRILLQTVRTASPKAKILLIGLLPRNDRALDPAIQAVNNDLKTCTSVSNVTYLDLADVLQEPDAYMSDKLHLSDFGYQRVMPLIAKALDGMGMRKIAPPAQ